MTRHYIARYVLRNGARGSLSVIATDSCAAVLAALEQFGERIQRLSVRPAGCSNEPR